MKNIEWNKLKKIADWAEVLNDLLDEAKSATEKNDSEKRREIRKLLVKFVEKSPLKCANLSDIASEEAKDIISDQVDERLKAIASRNAELKKLVRLMNDVTAEAREDEKELQFKTLIETIGTIKGIAETLKNVEGTFTDPEADVLDKIEAVVEAVKKYEEHSNTN